MADTPPGVAGVFDRVADRYDSVGVPWFGPVAAGLLEVAAPASGERLLDVGCGRGAVLVPAAHAVGPGGQVVGIDLAPRMVELTARDVRDLPWVRVEVGDARAPDLPEASFDVVTASLVLFFLPDPVAALAAWTRLLRPDGRLAVSTFGPQEPVWAGLDDAFTPHLSPAMLDARAGGRRGPYASDDGVEGLLRSAGLAGVRTGHRTVEAVFADGGQWVRFTRSHGQNAMWDAVPEDARADLERDLVRRVDALRGDAPLRLPQPVRYTSGTRPG